MKIFSNVLRGPHISRKTSSQVPVFLDDSLSGLIDILDLITSYSKITRKTENPVSMANGVLCRVNILNAPFVLQCPFQRDLTRPGFFVSENGEIQYVK